MTEPAAAGASMLEQVREGGLLESGEPLVAMVSGGRDSVCLLDLAVRLLGSEAVTAVHVNYGLRPGGSDEDEAHCVALCEALGVALEVEVVGLALLGRTVGLEAGDRRGLPGREGAGLRHRNSCMALW